METIEASFSSIEDSPSYEKDLALDWALSLDDIQFIVQVAKGDQQTLYVAILLNSLKSTGDFFNTTQLSHKIIHYLSKQLDIPPPLAIKVSIKSKLLYQKKVKDYLGFRDFSNSEEKLLQDYIQEEMKMELFSVDSLKNKIHAFLKAQKIIRPAPTTLDRKISTDRKIALSHLYDRIANKISAEQKSKILSLLKCQPHLLSQMNYFKKSPPEPTSSKINTFINRFNELNALGVTQIDFSDISERVFNQLEVLGMTYDAHAIKKLSDDNKKIALLLCTLASASQGLLDHILDMNEKLLTKKERISTGHAD